MFKVMCLSLISLMTGMAIEAVGRVPKNLDEPYTFWLPITILFVMGVPAILGYLAGLEDATK